MRIVLTVVALLLSTIGFSQGQSYEKPDTLNSTQIMLDEVSINAPIRLGALQQWSGSFSLIDSLKMELGNSYQISNQLNSLPGVLMQQGTFNTSRITIRGIGSRTPYNSNRIKVYWGDIPLTDGDGVSSIEDIGFNDIHSIMVLKGPSSALYGAGLGGVILINPWTIQNNGYKHSLQSEVGSYGTFSNLISTSLKGKKGHTWLNVNHLQTDGYRDNSEYKRYNITLKGKYQLGKSYLHYLYNYRHLYGQIPSSLDSTDFYKQPTKAADSWAAIEGYEKSNRHILNVGLSSMLSPSVSHTINIFGITTSLDELRPFNRLDESKRSLGLRDKLTYQSKLFNIDGGIEAMLENNALSLFGVKEHSKGERLSENKIQRNYFNVFGLINYLPNSRLSLQTGFNLNLTNYSNTNYFTTQKTTHHYPLVFSPRAGASYQIFNHSNIYAALGHGFSPPSVEEAQMPDGSFNPDIKPEEGYHIDVGYRFVSKNNNTSAEITTYWMKMNNLLVTKRESEEVFYGVNAGATSHQGIEARLNHRVFINANTLTFNASYTQSLNTFDDFTDDGVNYQNNHLPGIPEYSLFIQTIFTTRSNTLQVNYRHNGMQYLNDSNSKRYKAFGVLNAKLNHTVKWNALKANIYLGANNLLNQHYASMLLINAPSFGNKPARYYYPGLPFNMYGGLSICI
ncbi:TonB-dependent receptor [Carboxylicivirga sp. M1479]|uniref:TonB-dependent receptor n=1 Tax=Carboxylicivirga sp. M1479 TaxID=2594476 RepID=UPI0011777E6D|nr:TonB-dependent receptor [Carboxylicivirga sp. M1479]TRX65914.1 hypothetical protein FNN09_16105 [Carboxylicivirga sp. M1479]